MSEEAEDPATDLEGAARALGLDLDDRGRLTGTDPHGVRVLVDRSDAPVVRVEARLEPPLMMGLEARVRSADEPPEPGTIGLPGLERAFAIEAADPEHAQRVLGPCVPALLDAAERQPSLRIDDERVRVELTEPEADARALLPALQLVAVVARWLRGARSQQLADWERKLSTGWPTIAATWGLWVDLGRLRMGGAVDGAAVEVWIEPGPLPRTALRVTIPRLGFHLSLSRAGDEALAERFAVGEAIETGDPELDAYRVVGEPEEAVRARLTPEARGQLAQLLERASAVSFEDEAVELWSPGAVTHGAGIEAMIADARQAAERLREAPEQSPSGHGPYRSR